MKSFDAVREACFGMELDDDYAQRIQKFKDDYLILFSDYGFSVTVKAHDTFFHITPWLERWEIPLGVVGESAGESLHRRLNKFIENKQCASPESEDYGQNLLKVGVAWNSHAAILYED